ncbi:MAG: hypothetical protein AVDCRST_MAG89-3467 [uncultured Gemmatimonadetes bacterium]|uniref:Uncharacterized protein n=1 Tax=uncultured Gemmatimonadota bacterium TaxID=203437 RepID=A0A6J4MDF7_9BACT|nr:MAG: hypothetical protein AVDCRST_MAG89-3467 [uncultured Gemmatimonadota bacterium]
MNDTNPVPAAVRVALDEAEHRDRMSTIALVAAAMIEAVLLGYILTEIDFGDPVHKLMFLLSLLTYCTLGLGLAALAAKTSAQNARLMHAIQLMSERR